MNILERLKYGLKNGDNITRLSYLVMGAGSFLRKQYHRGIAFVSIQIIAIVYFISSGFSRIKGLRTLGTVAAGRVFDEDRGIYINTKGDNSMLFLLFGVLAVILLVVFLYLYYLNIENSIHNQELQEEGKPLKTLKEDVSDLLDGKFHITVLSIPSLLTVAFTVLPLIFMILIAFTNFDKAHQPPGTMFTWVGFENFRVMFYESKIISGTFFALLKWTFIWAFFATFLNYILGMLLAMLINAKPIKMKKMWRTIFVITIAIPQFVSLLLMSKLLADQGTINQILIKLGHTAIPFLSNPTIAKITLITVNLWVGIPYTMLITSGILMNIPQDMYESAKIDGATPLVQFTKITLPYMLSVTAPYLITQFVGNFNNFNVIYLLTGGGPLTLKYHKAGHTDLLVTWLYKLTVDEKNYALASTLGIVIFAISATLSLIVFRKVTQGNKEGEFQ
ncbi:MAG: sugar ABC transporter permease [Erysipelothrix sp.]|nr:sugar ABC transporter permease [Erysipelothrix sp.]